MSGSITAAQGDMYISRSEGDSVLNSTQALCAKQHVSAVLQVRAGKGGVTKIRYVYEGYLLLTCFCFGVLSLWQ